MRFLRSFLATAAVAAVATGCELAVTNPNNPDRTQVLGNPSDVEALAASQFQQILSATHGNTASAHTGMRTASLMNASTLANNGMGPRSIIPRQAVENNTGNAYETENYREYRLLSFVARNSVDILNAANVTGFSLGPGRESDVDRLKAWTFFVYGLSTGYLAMVYDSAGIPRLDDPAGAFVPPLYHYTETGQLSLALFDSAIAYASRSGVTALPGGWLNGPGGADVGMAQFRRVIRSYAAVVRAGLARNPAERNAVNWDQVIADATNGIESDFMVNMNPSLGWDYSWLATTLHFRDANWHQMTPYIIGMADVSGGFAQWLAVPRDEREPFLIVTPDERFPQGATRAAQNRSAAEDDEPLPAGQYIRNRLPGKDQAAVGWRNSFYDHYRHRAWAQTRIGEFPLLTKAEVDMLAAEGHIRRGNIAAAAALIDRTRTEAGLPALTGAVTSATQPVPGGSECVPQVPTASGAVVCGTIMEAMKWEKRMENAYTSYGAWYFDARGWGDLVIGTPEQWPVPVQDMNARGLSAYNLGGIGAPSGAATNTYGYGEGSR